MEVLKTLAAGQPGTKRYLRQYGERLVCVRHRRDSGRRYITVGRIVDEPPDGVRYRAVSPEEREPATDLPAASSLFAIQVGVRGTGERWDPKLNVWSLQRAAVRRLGLRGRVVSV